MHLVAKPICSTKQKYFDKSKCQANYHVVRLPSPNRIAVTSKVRNTARIYIQYTFQRQPNFFKKTHSVQHGQHILQ